MNLKLIFLSKIWAFALLVSISFSVLLDYIECNNFHFPSRLLIFSCIFLLPIFLMFLQFGDSILINSEIDITINYKKELLKLAIFISVIIWLVNFFFFSLMGNLSNNHFYTLPFFLAMVFGIYFFKIKNVHHTYDENVLDENLDFNK